ncbi:secreted RxLR effector protein 161-like [Nicotiana tomentosiformis]|uniref:secreted RxLR effector protein 161-like n=1 Tax=Nicotiana tomentosiformis TaxID=4098 RepID=UPI000877F763|nr:secreted RxLR effector protein 161-like [Nicotiana tomentosiformis]
MGLSGEKPTITPLELNQKLTSLEYDKGIGSKVYDPLIDVTSCQKLIGKLLYLTVTRPDISYAVQILSQFMKTPKRSHMDAATRVVRYLKQALCMGVIMRRGLADALTGFCDSDWAACPISRRSVSGYLVKFGDSLISWRSKKQHTVSRSSVEAEYRSMASAVAEIMWLRGLFSELGSPIHQPVILFSNSKEAI